MKIEGAINNLKTFQQSFSDLSENVIPASNLAIEVQSGKEKIVEAINNKGGNVSVESSFEELANGISSLSIPMEFDLDGLVYEDGYTPASISEAIMFRKDHLVEIKNHTLTEWNNDGVFYQHAKLKKVTFSKLLSLNGAQKAFQESGVEEVNMPELRQLKSSYTFCKCLSLKRISLPKLEVMDTMTGGNSANYGANFNYCSNLEEVYLDNLYDLGSRDMFSGCTNLKKLYIPNLVSPLAIINYSNFANTNKLIDVITGARWVAGTLYRLPIQPTEAYNNSLSTLLTDEDIENGFTSNKQKWLWNLRNHIAANLPDVTGGTAGQIQIPSATLAEFDEETIAAFTNKNWSLIS